MTKSATSSSSTPRPSTSRARWGLLLVTLVMDAALILTALGSYLSARESSAAVAESVGLGMLREIRSEILGAGSETAEDLNRVLEERSDQGLRFIGIVDPAGTLLISAGSPQAQPAVARARARRSGPLVEPIGDGARFRVSAYLQPGRGRGQGHGRRGYGRIGGRARGRFLALEFEPIAAHAITSRALTTLSISLATAGLLLLATVFFWRLSRRADRIAAQLARDGRLKALGQMSAVLGHELRNPLTSLKGHIQLLLEKLPDDHPGRSGAETVLTEAIRLEVLTGQVLDFARTDTIDPAPVDPAELARTAIDRSEVSLVELQRIGEIPTWPMDGPRMEQVLVNLLRNARQASPDGEPIDVTLQMDEQDELVVAIRDRGAGFDDASADRIFEPFHTTRAKGTGLGLALAQRIVERHGGRITASNHPEGGAEFRITLPRT